MVANAQSIVLFHFSNLEIRIQIYKFERLQTGTRLYFKHKSALFKVLISKNEVDLKTKLFIIVSINKKSVQRQSR